MTELANIQISQNHFPKQPQEDEEDYEKLPQITFFHKITFALLGICSQSGWNAILNAFDFFQSKFPKQNFVDVAFYFPIPIMFTNFIISVTLVIIGNIVSIEKSIPFSLKGTVISLVSLSLIGIFLKYTLAGISLIFIFLIIQGTMSCLTNNLSVALSMATQNGILINIFFTFTSLSGVIMNILRFIALGAFGIEDLDNGTGIYFGVSAFLNLLGNIFINKFTNGQYYKAVQKRDQMRNQKLQQQQKQAIPNTEKDIDKFQDNQIVIGNDNQIQTPQNKQTAQQIQTTQKLDIAYNQNISFLDKVLNLLQIIGPAPFFIFIAYVQTFMLFPGVSVFQKPQYTLIKQPYALVFVFTIFNIGDLIGKAIGGIKFLQKQLFAYSVIIFRFAFFILFIFIANQQGSKDMQNDLFQYFLLFTFALTNGMVTSILMTIAPQRANNAKDRDFISYMSVFFLTFGITVGSFMALIFQKN